MGEGRRGTEVGRGRLGKEEYANEEKKKGIKTKNNRGKTEGKKHNNTRSSGKN
jgi:hypothetical protein